MQATLNNHRQLGSGPSALRGTSYLMHVLRGRYAPIFAQKAHKVSRPCCGRYISGKKVRRLLLFLLLTSSRALACEIQVPIEIEFDEKPTATEEGFINILAPLKHNGWSLVGVHFKKGKNRFSIMQYLSESDYPGKASFQLEATAKFLEDSEFTATYTPDLVAKDGKLIMMPCLHEQPIEIKI